MTVLDAPRLGKDLVSEAVAGVPARDEKGLPLQPFRVIGAPRLNPGPLVPQTCLGVQGVHRKGMKPRIWPEQVVLCARVASARAPAVNAYATKSTVIGGCNATHANVAKNDRADADRERRRTGFVGRTPDGAVAL